MQAQTNQLMKTRKMKPTVNAKRLCICSDKHWRGYES